MRDIYISFFFFLAQEIGASLLSVISFPAFAVENKDIVKITKSEIIGRLEVRLHPKFILHYYHHYYHNIEHVKLETTYVVESICYKTFTRDLNYLKKVL